MHTMCRGYYISIDDSFIFKLAEESKSEDAAKTLVYQSDIGMKYYSDLTMNLKATVAGGKNLMESDNKMELDVLTDTIEQKVHNHFRLSIHMIYFLFVAHGHRGYIHVARSSLFSCNMS
jgi:hypothetical protein